MQTSPGGLVVPLAVSFLLAGPPIFSADCNGNAIEDANETELAFEPMARKTTRVADNVVIADLNGDRAPDVVMLRSSAVAVFLQASPWVLGDPLITELPVEQRDIAAADLDGDDVEEIVTAGREGILVLRSRGGGGLEVRQSLLIGEPVALRLVDLDGDGRLDVVTGNFQDPPSVSVALNDGSGNLREPRSFAAGSETPRFFDAADLDGDGDADLAILDNFDLLVMENDGSAGFSRTLSSPLEEYGFRGPFLADLEGDGDTDVMALAKKQVLVLRNDGAGAFVNSSEFVPASWNPGVSPEGLLGDFEGDGDPDLLLGAMGCAELALIPSERGALEAPLLMVSIDARELIVLAGEDLDLDGRLDVVGEDGFPWIQESELVLLRNSLVPKGDCDRDGTLDECEPDCNSNLRPDDCDIAAAASQDMDANAIPDECDPDCNGNGTPDARDLATGAEPDCNSDGVPDSCQAELDRNRNGVPDACDIANRISHDCDADGIPDESDVEQRLALPHRAIDLRYSPGHDGIFPADFDGDGRTDLLVRGRQPVEEAPEWNGIFLLRNLGAPLPVPDFHESKVLDVAADALEVLDFEGDGDPDAAFAAPEGCRSRIVLLENAGKGQLRRSGSHDLGLGPVTDIVASDVDEDGRVDILALAESVWLLRGLGNGSFETPAAVIRYLPRGSTRLLALHADSDGDLDLATDAGRLFRGTAGDRFAPAEPFPSRPGLIGALDFDTDGDQDIVTSGLVALNSGEGRSWAEQALREQDPEDVRDVVVADFDGDGKHELALAASQSIRTYRHRNFGLLVSSYPVLFDSADLAAGDLDGDGRADLVSASTVGRREADMDGYSLARLGIHPNAGDGTFHAHRTFAEGLGLWSADTLDLEGDGDLDLVGVEPPLPSAPPRAGQSRLVVLENAGDAFFFLFRLDHEVHNYDLADVEGDGDTDIVLGGPDLRFLVNDGFGSFAPGEAIPVSGDVEAVDLDRNGEIDFLLSDFLGESLQAVLRGLGGAHEVRTLLLGRGEVRGVLPGDIDADGDIDLVATLHERAVVMENSGNAEFLDPVPMATGRRSAVLLADLSGDGLPDLITSDCSHCEERCDCGSYLSVLMNDGTGGFGPPVLYPEQLGSERLEAPDLDLDGDIDVLLAESGGVTFLLNRGDGSLVPWGAIAVGNGVRSLTTGRFDGDSSLDIAVYTSGGGIILPVRVSTADADRNGAVDACETGGFRRGDWNQDGVLNLADPISLLGSLFLGAEGFGCEDSGDADDDGRLAITDAIRVLHHLFLAGPPPEEPFDRCSTDPTREDGLSCGVFAGC